MKKIFTLVCKDLASECTSQTKIFLPCQSLFTISLQYFLSCLPLSSTPFRDRQRQRDWRWTKVDRNCLSFSNSEKRAMKRVIKIVVEVEGWCESSFHFIDSLPNNSFHSNFPFFSSLSSVPLHFSSHRSQHWTVSTNHQPSNYWMEHLLVFFLGPMDPLLVVALTGPWMAWSRAFRASETTFRS